MNKWHAMVFALAFSVVGWATTPTQSKRTVSGPEIKTAMKAHLDSLKEAWSDTLNIQAKYKEGVKSLKILLTEIHPARKVNETEYFDCINFVDVTDPKNVVTYDLDFWFTLKNGKLTIQPERTEIHKINGVKLFDYNSDGMKIPVVG